MLSEVVGQEQGVRYLQTVVDGRYSSPLMLVGDEGVGRRFAVFNLTQQLFCQEDGATGCKCYSCKQLGEGTHVDFVTVSAPDDKELGVEQIRDVIAESDSYPLTAPVKVFLIEGADRMTTAASNAILKTLEEPPAKSRFFLLAEDETKVIPTIRSRCGVVPFFRLSEAFILSKVLQFEEDETKARVYTRMSEGSVGRAIRYWGAGRITFRDRIISLLSAAANKDIPSVFSMISSLEKELNLGLRMLDQIVHDLLIAHHDALRMIHLDARETIIGIRKKMSDEVCHRLSTGVQNLIRLTQRTRIHLPFHLSTLLVTAFAES